MQGAGGGFICPYKSICRGGRHQGPSLKIDLQGRAKPPPVPTNHFPYLIQNSFKPENIVNNIKKKVETQETQQIYIFSVYNKKMCSNPNIYYVTTLSYYLRATLCFAYFQTLKITNCIFTIFHQIQRLLYANGENFTFFSHGLLFLTD